MGETNVKELNLLPGDIVENKVTLRGDKGNSVSRGAKFKVVATDGDEAALVRLIVADFINAEVFISNYKYLKVTKTPTNIQVIEPEKKNETSKTRKNRRYSLKGYFKKRNKQA